MADCQSPMAVVHALVLTAGLGTRLDPLTRLVAKAAAPLAGRTLAERALLWLHRQDVRDVVLNLHYKPDTITGVVGDGSHLGVRVRYSWEQPILGSAGGPRHALDLLESDPFLFLNGDTLCDVPLAPMVEAHQRSGALATMALVPNPAPDFYNGVRLDAEDRVTEFVPAGPAATGTFHFIGIQVVSKSVLAPLADGVPAETVKGVYREHVRTSPGAVRGWRVTLPFVDIGTPQDYLRTALTFSDGERGGSIVEAGAKVDPSARLTRTVVWADATIGAAADLDECIVAGPVTVPAGFRARGVIIQPAATARPGDGAALRDSVAVFPLHARP
jgi:mannose-1-phosphate guanylyltransferase